MKHLILVGIVLGLIGCTSDDDKTTPRRDDSSQVRELKEDNLNLAKKLETCEQIRENLTAQLQNAAAPQSAANSQSQETASEEPAQPTTEEVDAFELIKYGDTQVKVKCQKAEAQACGVSFSECEDGNAYDCLRDVKYKSVKMTITQ
jgi:hypothetical protein